MSEKKTNPDNIIRVNFKKSKQHITLKSLYPEAFAIYVDTESENPDDFSKAVLEAVKEKEEEEEAFRKATNPDDNDDD